VGVSRFFVRLPGQRRIGGDMRYAILSLGLLFLASCGGSELSEAECGELQTATILLNAVSGNEGNESDLRGWYQESGDAVELMWETHCK